MIVLDASALTDWLLGTPLLGAAVAARIRSARSLHTLDMAYVEVISALRQKLRRGELSGARADVALADLAETPLRRHPAAPLSERIWTLRSSHSAYDAAYVALAEVLSAPLLTTDRRLARSQGHRALILEASTQ